MTSKKITFYADDDVQQWYASLPKHAGSREINKLLRTAIQANRPSSVIDDETITARVEDIEENIADLFQWRQELPGLAIFEELESSDIKEGLELIGHYKEDLKHFCDQHDALTTLQKEFDFLNLKIEKLLNQ